MNATPHRIDTHHHIMPSWYVEAATRGGRTAGDVDFPKWDVPSTLALMDRNGIATAIASVAAPGVFFDDQPAANALARRSNEYLAKLIREYPARFGGFAVLPLPDVDAAIAEAVYALDMLELDGVVLLTNLDGRYLGDPALDPLFTELNRRKATIFVHPNVPPQSPKSKLALPGALVEFVFDTTRAAANLIYSGTMERNPDLNFILSHAGGTVPFLAHRLTMGDTAPHLRELAPKGAIAYLKRFYYDVAIAANPYALSALKELADPAHIVFGSDHPFYPEPLIEGTVAGLQRYSGFDDKIRMGIDRDNALALFPRLRTRNTREPQIA